MWEFPKKIYGSIEKFPKVIKIGTLILKSKPYDLLGFLSLPPIN